MTPWRRRIVILVGIGVILILILPQAIRFILFREGLPFGLQQRFGITGTVQDLGWRHMDISQIAWGPLNEAAIEIGAVRITFTPSGLLAKTLDNATISELTIHLAPGADGLHLRGRAETQQQTPPPPATAKNWALPLPFRQLDIRSGHIIIHDQTKTTDIPFQLHLDPSQDQPGQVLFTAALLADGPTPTIHGMLDLATATLQSEFSCPLPSLARFWPELDLPGATLAGRCDLSLTPQGSWTLSTDATLSDSTKGGTGALSLQAGKVMVSPIHIQGQGEGQGPEGKLTLSGTIDRLDAAPVTLQQLAFTLPWSWPTPARPEVRGTLAVTAISLNNKNLGTLGLTIRQTDRAAASIDGAFNGGSTFPARAKIKAAVLLDPKTKKPQFDLSLIVPSLDLKAFDWQSLIPLNPSQRKDLQPIDLAGTITATITAKGDTLLQQADAAISITEGGLTMTKEKVTVSGVSGTIQLSNLLAGSKGLKGGFTARNAAIADIHLSDGTMKFHGEGTDSVIVEQVKAGWSGGTIQALNLRLTKGSSDLAGELQCDQLDLAQLLSQLGISQVSGKGTISGRIPMKYSAGKLEITQGLLSSTAGGGTLRLAAREMITGGVPAGTPQFSQLQFAAAALEDFSYTQLSMGVESQGEEMVIALSIDGHPAKPLPFRYDARLGTFSQITGSGEVGVNQPVKLDVNFRLPFNELLGYGESIKNLRDQLR